MKLPQSKKILKEDVKDAPSWVDNIIGPINSFMETVYQAMNKNITLSENIASFLKEITYTTPSTYPSGVDNVEILNTLKSRAIGVMVMQAYEKNTYIPAAGAVYVPWVESNTNIVISTITGLAASKTYIIRLLVY